MKFRKKPVVIDAIRFTGSESFARMMNVWKRAFDEVTDGDGTKDNFFIETLEGTHCANLGDWIIKGVKGEFYPCKPDIFEMTHEPPMTKPKRPLAQRMGLPEPGLLKSGKRYYLASDVDSMLKRARPVSATQYDDRTYSDWVEPNGIDNGNIDGVVVILGE